TRSRLLLEVLEDRTVPSGVEWLLRLQGLPGDTTAQQMQAAQALIDAAHIPDIDIAVVDHIAIDGNVVIEAPQETPLDVLDHDLQGLPGFLDIVPFVGGDEGAQPQDPTGDDRPPDFSSPAPGPNVNV